MPVLDNPVAPEFFCVGAASCLVNKEIINLSMVSPRVVLTPNQTVTAVVNVRLVMTLVAAEEFAHYILNEINRQLDRQITSPPAKDDTKH
jgi:hypothetical protein